MRPLPAILCLATVLSHTTARGDDEPLAAESPAPAPKKIPAIAALPDGSELEGVVLPRYDEQLRLTGSLRAEKLTLVDASQIKGRGVAISLMDAETARTTLRVDLASAIVNQETGVIRADEAVTLVGERFTATGSALHFAFEQRRGFVSGPATTTLHAPEQTAMNPTSTRPAARPLAAAAVGIALVAAPPLPGRPMPLDADELAELERAAAPHSAAAASEAAAARATVADTRETSDAISSIAHAFLVNNVAEAAEAAQPAARQPAAPLDIQPGPGDTRIEADGGFYFDAGANLLVYLGNVRVTDPRFTLTGVDELKVIFGEKPAPAEDAGEKDAGEKKPDDLAAGFAAGVGDVERVIATGRVLFKQTQPQDGKPPVEASGALFNYDIARGEIVLSGGYPWVRQGGYYARALEPTLNLRIKRDGSFVTEGPWDSGANLQRNR